MTVNLMISTVDANEISRINWTAIQTASGHEHGFVFIDDQTVTKIARLLEGLRLTNGEIVTAYAYDEDDCMSSFVPAFAPSLLPTIEQGFIRNYLAAAPNGDRAVALFDEVIRLEVQISLCGAEHCPAYIKGVNAPADEIEINRTSSNMMRMMRDLRLDGFTQKYEGVSRDIPLETFERAVVRYADATDMPEMLHSFLAFAKRRNAQSVYWA